MKELKKTIHKFIGHEFVVGSFFVFLGTFVGSVFSFLYNLFLARNLSTIDYGIYASITSLVVFLGIPAQSISTAIIRFGTEYVSKKEYSKARVLYNHATRFTVGLGLSFLVGFFLFAPFLSQFLKIGNPFFIILGGFFLVISYISVVNNSFLQSLLHFRFLSFLGSLGNVLKLLLGMFFVFLGWKVFGALVALILSTAIPYLLAFFPIKKIFTTKESGSVAIKPIILYALPMSLAIISASSFTYMDVILVKHFFNPHEAGLYAGLSLVGKVIFYFTLPIPTVMFPILVKYMHTGKKTDSVFYLSLLFALLPALGITAIYFLFPQLMIRIFLGGGAYLAVAPLLGYEGLYLSLFSLLNIVINFFLSVHKTKIAIPVAIGSITQILGIWFFHKTLFEVLSLSIVIVLVLLIMLLLYYLHGKTQSISS